MTETLPAIGIFDSGIGGLSVLKACLETLSPAVYYYYGDNGRAPYGSRGREEIGAFVREALTFFLDRGVQAAVLACNTATTVCVREMRAAFPFPIVGTEPAVRPAARECRRALVLATPRTAESARLRALIGSCKSCAFTVLACPSLATAVEAHFTAGAPLTLSDHIPPDLGEKFDGAVLGCTHYVLVKEQIAAFLGCKTYDGSLGIARQVGKTVGIGTDDHFFSKNSNKCFYFDPNKSLKNRVFFVGNCQTVNESVFYSNICFR